MAVEPVQDLEISLTLFGNSSQIKQMLSCCMGSCHTALSAVLPPASSLGTGNSVVCWFILIEGVALSVLKFSCSGLLIREQISKQMFDLRGFSCRASLWSVLITTFPSFSIFWFWPWFISIWNGSGIPKEQKKKEKPLKVFVLHKASLDPSGHTLVFRIFPNVCAWPPLQQCCHPLNVYREVDFFFTSSM